MPYRVLGDTYFTTSESSLDSPPVTYLDHRTASDSDDSDIIVLGPSTSGSSVSSPWRYSDDEDDDVVYLCHQRSIGPASLGSSTAPDLHSLPGPSGATSCMLGSDDDLLVGSPFMSGCILEVGARYIDTTLGWKHSVLRSLNDNYSTKHKIQNTVRTLP